MEHPRTSSVATASSATENTNTTNQNQTNTRSNSTTSANTTNIPDTPNLSTSSISSRNSGDHFRNIQDSNNSNTDPIHASSSLNTINLSNSNVDSDMDIDLDYEENVENDNVTANGSSISPSADLFLDSDKTTNTLNEGTVNSHSNSTLFKQFDSKTGQFLRDNIDDSLRSNINKDTTITNHPNSDIDKHTSIQSSSTLLLPTPLQRDSNKTNLHTKTTTLNQQTVNNIPPALKILSNMKSRSYSVPTILHSSLKRLSTNNGIYNHPMGGNPHLIMKNKVSKNIYTGSNSNITDHGHHHHHHHHHHNSHRLTKNIRIPSNAVSDSTSSSCSSSNSSTPPLESRNRNDDKSNRISSASLKNAIMLNQQGLISSTNNHNVISLQERINYFNRQKSPKLNMLLPPINLQCLKEIDLQEIVKNPQLRHDIIFDPLLQFRPNLDGERGVKKRHISDSYWNDIETELIIYMNQPSLFNYHCTRLVPLFDTLRDILLTIVPQREYQQIMNILDTELNVQSLVKSGATWSNMNDLATWLSQLFKHHCAPMRDSWVDKMKMKFNDAMVEHSMSKLIEGFKLVFQILEAMKLDIANHQIRLLRPALLSNSVEFERQYFNSLMNGVYVSDDNSKDNKATNINSNKKFLLRSSLVWFKDKFNDYSTNIAKPEADDKLTIPDIYRASIKIIINLLSCRKMVREYPTSLSFDHARLILLRADIRQLVCLLVCRLLFQQLVANDKKLLPEAKRYILNNYDNNKLQNEIISIITDEHGNCRWTKNTLSIAVHLCKVINDLTLEYEEQKANKTTGLNIGGNKEQKRDFNTMNASNSVSTNLPALDNQTITFAKSWLSKQTQPLSEIYGVLENRVFLTLANSIFDKSECTIDGRVKQDFVYLYNPVGEASLSSGNGTDSSSSDASSSIQSDSNKSSGSSSKDANKLLPFKPLPSSSKTKSNSNIMAIAEMEQFENIYRHLYTIINLHWSVFGSHYIDVLGDKVKTV